VEERRHGGHGTAAGTVLVKDIKPGAGFSSPGSLTLVDGTLFFAADDGLNGRELWASDGTAAGTVLVKDINPGAGDSAPYELATVNGTLFFRADDGTTGEELWTSDGTAAGTVRTVGGGWTMAALVHPAAPIATSSSSTPWIPCSTWRPAPARSKSSRPWRDTSWPRLN